MLNTILALFGLVVATTSAIVGALLESNDESEKARKSKIKRWVVIGCAAAGCVIGASASIVDMIERNRAANEAMERQRALITKLNQVDNKTAPLRKIACAVFFKPEVSAKELMSSDLFYVSVSIEQPRNHREFRAELNLKSESRDILAEDEKLFLFGDRAIDYSDYQKIPGLVQFVDPGRVSRNDSRHCRFSIYAANPVLESGLFSGRRVEKHNGLSVWLVADVSVFLQHMQADLGNSEDWMLQSIDDLKNCDLTMVVSGQVADRVDHAYLLVNDEMIAELERPRTTATSTLTTGIIERLRPIRREEK